MKSLDLVTGNGRLWSVPDEISELRVGLVGAGKMARLHLQTLRSMSGVRVTAICNRTSTAAAQLAHEFGIDQVYQDPGTMLANASLDALFVAVSHAATFPVASSVLRSSIPCLIEKPAGTCVNETTELARLAGINKCFNLVCFKRRIPNVGYQALLAVF